MNLKRKIQMKIKREIKIQTKMVMKLKMKMKINIIEENAYMARETKTWVPLSAQKVQERPTFRRRISTRRAKRFTPSTARSPISRVASGRKEARATASCSGTKMAQCTLRRTEGQNDFVSYYFGVDAGSYCEMLSHAGGKTRWEWMVLTPSKGMLEEEVWVLECASKEMARVFKDVVANAKLMN